MTSGTSFMATENFSVSPLPGTSRHQSFPQIDNSLLCLERSGLRCRPVVQRVLSLPVGQDHHPHHSSSPTDPSPLTEVLSYQCRPGGPLQVSSGGHTHVMTIIDRSTIWAEMVPLISTTATACAEALVAGWISHFGVPTAMTTDRGVQCTSAVWSVLCQRLGIKHITTTAYHPQSNGMIERFHRQLKDSLRARLASTDWPSHLPWVLLGLRAAPKEDHNMSAAELLYGVPLALLGELVDNAEPPAAIFLERFRRLPTTALPTRPLARPPPPKSPPAKLDTAGFVFVRRGAPSLPLSPLYDGPCRVVARGPKVFTLEIGGRQDQFSVDRLNPA